MASETEVLDFLSQSPYWTMASRIRKWGPPLHCINNLDVNISIFMELSHRVWQLRKPTKSSQVIIIPCMIV